MAQVNDDVFRATLHAVRLYGLEGFRVRQIGEFSKGCSSAIYNKFAGKDALLRACFEQVDHRIASIFERVHIQPQLIQEDPQAAVRQLWAPFFRWLVMHPEETEFYHRYREGTAFASYDKVRDVGHYAALVRYLRAFDLIYHTSEQIHAKILYIHVLNTTLAFARHVINGKLPDTDKTQEDVFSFLWDGEMGLLGRPAPAGGKDE